MISILDENYGEHFGFTVSEVEELLNSYGRNEKPDIVSRWYGGYKFGNAEVYNPWSALNYAKALYFNPEAPPPPYKEEIEMLIAGGTKTKPVHEDITYADIYQPEDNLWNFLFFTGYLKQISRELKDGYCEVLNYGITFFRKQCRVRAERKTLAFPSSV